MSIFDDRSAVSIAPSWRCPHCRTLQPEASRCRTCSRATVSCATCVRYRRSVVNGVGYCADDPARSPLDGEEVRGCWSDGRDAHAGAAATGLFDDVGPAAQQPRPPAAPVAPPVAADPSPAIDDGLAHGLVEAPYVAPAGDVVSALHRRLRRGHGT